MNIKERNIVTSVILSLVTCGIYGFYWAYCMAKEAVSVNDENDGAILEAILCMFLPFVGFFLTEKKFAQGCADKGIEHKDNTILYIILGIVFPIANYCLLQNDLNKLATPAE
ncbi:MAG: DUF4234 domain-containing protein [Clostridia bacterium]|nr:DUF4234 domain-containing protein [Clostridia bacterium]